MKKYLQFLLASYVTAITFETIANTIGDGKLFQAENWSIFFLIWYGAIYSVTYFIFRNRPLWMPVLAWAIAGPVVEIFVFGRLNAIVDPIIYAIMFLIPFWVYHKL